VVDVSTKRINDHLDGLWCVGDIDDDEEEALEYNDDSSSEEEEPPKVNINRDDNFACANIDSDVEDADTADGVPGPGASADGAGGDPAGAAGGGGEGITLAVHCNRVKLFYRKYMSLHRVDSYMLDDTLMFRCDCKNFHHNNTFCAHVAVAMHVCEPQYLCMDDRIEYCRVAKTRGRKKAKKGL
jgi:hypothetical protein